MYLTTRPVVLFTITIIYFVNGCLNTPVQRGDFSPVTKGNGYLIPEKQHDQQSLGSVENRSVINTSESKIRKTDAENEICTLKIDSRSINRFRHAVTSSESNFVFLNLTPAHDSGIVFKHPVLIIGDNIWIWTFWGQKGAFEFLKWPAEFGIWSMTLLYAKVIRKPLNIPLQRKSGNCLNITVGNKDDDKKIAKALKSLVDEMMTIDADMYGPSFVCYKKRMYIEPYVLCKHIVCPIEAVKHKCCNYFYNNTFVPKRETTCREQTLKYDTIWWALPSIVSVTLFIYSPIFIMYTLYRCFSQQKSTIKLSEIERRRNPRRLSNVDVEYSHRFQNKDTFIFEDTNHVTLVNTLFIPMKECHDGNDGDQSNCVSCYFGRCARLFFPFLSFIIIGLQLLLDYIFLYDFVIDSADSGVLLGFRSMVTGYSKSKENFLPYIGGPYVALACYLLITELLVVMPASPMNLLSEAVLVNRTSRSEFESSPILLTVKRIGILGSKNVSVANGYYKIYTLFIAQFFMLLNIKFWKHAIAIQLLRWRKIKRKVGYVPFLPFYLALCIVELLLSLLIYGLPIISFGIIIVKAYCRPLRRHAFLYLNGLIGNYIWTAVLVLAVLYFLFMFGNIFLDATLFISRVAIFTFTGLVVYPKSSYGYMIFVITVFYYISESISEYSMKYRQLLSDIVKIASSLERGNTCLQRRMICKYKGRKAVRESLFELVVETICPRRKLVFLTFLKTVIVLGILLVCINLLIKTDSFKELHIIMHVGTALLICAIPQIFKRICKDKQRHNIAGHYGKELTHTVKTYLGYFEEADSDSSEDEAHPFYTV
ncbi:uncharacterized protein LOC128234982 [Mya arenaria]|uniref:uncharacterized protein LOC128234982 n=1 Tax=Mya arenaria TaxID=6604 RepID=UPI0022E7079D|nr:uncharacterized protein LOC128234982 [Mya arenaria]